MNPPIAVPEDSAGPQLRLQVDGMTCASCVARVERALPKMPGVVSASVDPATEKATAQALSGVSVLEAAVEKAGYAEGRPSLVSVQAAIGQARDEVLRLAAALQRTSGHPLARAVVECARAERLSVPEAHEAKALPGRGLFWPFAYDVVGIPLAALGLLGPVIAGAAMAASSVSVVADALLLRRWRGDGAGSAASTGPAETAPA